MREPLWVTADEVIELNKALVAATGEKHLVRDQGALEGALNRPVSYYQYDDVREVHFLAGYLTLAIGKAHAFEQGNKRTAWAAARLFIHNNGYSVKLTEMSQQVAAWTIDDMMNDEDRVKQLIHFLGSVIEPV
ncbi:type II toxin-antitoxin system death-on-curing family toxin [Rhizobium lentis]|uniref:type II toxin-antitoxin system death-on-curing family toxin n=1 Tax=Rhizobium lentis TaxID=1138194 RepID=UPI001C83FD54|nr:type II toxin-antitoxin system death-on-curing family toxin [Rhizobium lentis]MBX4954744.1 type II toxin-antitoxin system death-on-curing family toxin [Rhizobium lentis]MBX5034537.1 type II toxin-antitoxin system death-on-curing family toxin [Rhizobium lentis]